MTRSGHGARRLSRNGIYGMSRRRVGLVWLGTGELDHLGPLLCFVRNELAEVGRGKGKHRAAQLGEPRLQLRVDESRIDLLVELVNDLRGRVLRSADPVPRARL